MKFISKTNIVQLASGLNAINPYCVPAKKIENPISKTWIQSFDFFVEIDVDGVLIPKKIESFDIHFNRDNIPAIIVVNDLETDLLAHFMSGGSLDITKVKQLGKPKYDDLGYYFVNNFGAIEFADVATKPLAIFWVENTIMFDGKPLAENFELEL